MNRPIDTQTETSSPEVSTPIDPAAWGEVLARLRPGQRQMAEWQGGPLAVSAVPGAGKSTGMARAAAIAIARFRLNPQRQLLVVTLTRAAAGSLKAKIRETLKDLGLPQQGFTVQTLHSLAFQIAGREPGRSGLPASASLVVVDRSHRLIRDCVDRWLSHQPDLTYRLLLGQGFDGEESERLRRQSVLRTEVLPEIAITVVPEAKSSGLTPADLAAWARAAGEQDAGLGLAIAAGLYGEYEALLRERQSIDYDDAITAALRVLADPDQRRLWQRRVFAVFEDEAQDSTPLQNRLIETLATDPIDPLEPLEPIDLPEPLDPIDPERSEASPAKTQAPLGALNLIRVGDPNQAINSTFTPADPRFFRDFCDRCHGQGRLAQMTHSGRSSPIIISAANAFLAWANARQAANPARDRPFVAQSIETVDPDDPQPNANPAPIGLGLELVRPQDIHASVAEIGQRSHALLSQQPDLSLAVLVRTNDQGRFVAQSLNEAYGHRLPVLEVGARDRQSHVPAELLALCQWLSRPHSPDRLKAVLRILTDRQLIPRQDLDRLAALPEQFLYPGPLDRPLSAAAQTARRLCTGLLAARSALPHYHLISFIALTLQYDRNELATADKLASELALRAKGNSQLSTTIGHLSEITTSESFEAVDAETNDDAPYTRPGQLTIITMHKAKGLDWDGVFMPFLQANSLPGQLRVPLQRTFLGEFDLAECIRIQLRSILHQNQTPPDWLPAWAAAQHLKEAEEYRLFYVALTRAKRFLWLAAERSAPFTWHKPEALQDLNPSPAFLALEQQFPANAPK